MNGNESIVSVEVRNRVHGLCRDYLGGEWTRVDQLDLTIRPATDGVINQVFYSFLPENIVTKPNKVVVRIVDYEKLKEAYDYTSVLALSVVLSQKGISPKILGSFQYGTISEYIEGRYLTAEDDKNQQCMTRLAYKLADFQSLTIPIPKDRAKEALSGVYDRWFDNRLRDSYISGTIRQVINKNNHRLLAEHDFIEETNWLRKTIDDLGSPIVFSHNDLNRSNILIRETQDKSDFELFFIDFDWSCYHYRGADLGQYFAEWGQTDCDWDYHPFPSDIEMSVLINAYIKKMTVIFGESYAKQAINSAERLIKESKVFAMNAIIRNIIYCIWSCEETRDHESMKKAETQYRCYLELKKKYLNDYNC